MVAQINQAVVFRPRHQRHWSHPAIEICTQNKTAQDRIQHATQRERRQEKIKARHGMVTEHRKQRVKLERGSDLASTTVKGEAGG